MSCFEDIMLKFFRLSSEANRKFRESAMRDALWESEMREKYENNLVEKE